MKHAGPAALSHLHDLLADLRTMPGVEEMIQGIYHHSGVALLNFHASSAGCVADLRDGKAWKRYPVNTPAERDALLERIRAVLPAAKTAGTRARSQLPKIVHGMKLEPRERPPRPRLATHARKAGRKPGRVG